MASFLAKPAIYLCENALTLNPLNPHTIEGRLVADGDRPEWWFNVGASNNERLLRINFEAQEDEANS